MNTPLTLAELIVQLQALDPKHNDRPISFRGKFTNNPIYVDIGGVIIDELNCPVVISCAVAGSTK